jgi:hypothetical protein
VLEQAVKDRVVSFIDDPRTTVVPFCSNHDLGTALPPPLVGGLRPNSPVTCGFAVSRPALSRRPRAVGAGTTRFPWRARARAKERGRNLPPSKGVQFVPVLTSFARRSGMLRQASAGIASRRAVRVRAASPSRCVLRAFGPRPPRALRSRFASFISELASHEVPGFGAPALPSALGLEALAPALAIARGHGVSASGRRCRSCLRRHGNPAGVPSAETRPSLPVQRHPRGSNRVGEEGRVIGESSATAGQEASRGSGEFGMWAGASVASGARCVRWLRPRGL